jgi:phosphoglycolate phosphatase
MERIVTIKGILFDKDGTLIEVNGTWIPLYREALARDFAHSVDEVEDMLSRAGYHRESDTFIPGSLLAGGTMSQIAEVWWPDISPTQRRSRIDHMNNTVGPEARKFIKPLMKLQPVFAELHEMGLILGLGTNDSEASGRAHMEHLDVVHNFHSVIGADSVAVPKPSGQMIARFAELTGLAACEIAMVGDNTHDMDEAKAGGAGLAIGVLSGNAKHQDIAHLADYIVDSIADLPKLLKAQRHVL